AGPEVGRDRGAGHAGHDDRRHEGGELADRGEDEEAAEAVERSEQGQEVGGLEPGGAEPEGHRREQHREPAELEGEDELAHELAAVRVRGLDRGGDRLAGQDHHVPDLLEERLRGQEGPVGYGSDHRILPNPTHPWGPRTTMYSMAALLTTDNRQRSYRPRAEGNCAAARRPDARLPGALGTSAQAPDAGARG